MNQKARNAKEREDAEKKRQRRSFFAPRRAAGAACQGAGGASDAERLTGENNEVEPPAAGVAATAATRAGSSARSVGAAVHKASVGMQDGAPASTGTAIAPALGANARAGGRRGSGGAAAGAAHTGEASTPAVVRGRVFVKAACLLLLALVLPLTLLAGPERVRPKRACRRSVCGRRRSKRDRSGIAGRR